MIQAPSPPLRPSSLQIISVIIWKTFLPRLTEQRSLSPCPPRQAEMTHELTVLSDVQGKQNKKPLILLPFPFFAEIEMSSITYKH